MNPVDDKMHFLGQLLRNKNVLLPQELGGKQYIERDCCVVNSCHLNVLNLCVSIFYFLL